MSQIEELQGRILAAMDRITAGIDGISETGPAAAEPDAELASALEEEKLANAQLGERLKSLKEKHRSELEVLLAEQGESAGQGLRISELEKQVGELTNANDTQAGEISLLTRNLRTVTGQAEKLQSLDEDLQRLRAANRQLREVNTALREANAAGVGQPDLINRAMLAELESLRAVQAADAAEVGAVLGKLDVLLANARELPEGEEE